MLCDGYVYRGIDLGGFWFLVMVRLGGLVGMGYGGLV